MENLNRKRWLVVPIVCFETRLRLADLEHQRIGELVYDGISIDRNNALSRWVEVAHLLIGNLAHTPPSKFPVLMLHGGFHLFGDLRSFEMFQFLPVGMLSELPRKTLRAIAQLVGLHNGQSLPHFLRACGMWDNSKLLA